MKGFRDQSSFKGKFSTPFPLLTFQGPHVLGKKTKGPPTLFSTPPDLNNDRSFKILKFRFLRHVIILKFVIGISNCPITYLEAKYYRLHAWSFKPITFVESVIFTISDGKFKIIFCTFEFYAVQACVSLLFIALW